MKEDIKTDRLLRTQDVLEILNVSGVTLWRLVKKGVIPKPIKLTEGSINLYKATWIQEFIDSVDSNVEQIDETRDISRPKTKLTSKPSRHIIKKSEE